MITTTRREAWGRIFEEEEEEVQKPRRRSRCSNIVFYCKRASWFMRRTNNKFTCRKDISPFFSSLSRNKTCKKTHDRWAQINSDIILTPANALAESSQGATLWGCCSVGINKIPQTSVKAADVRTPCLWVLTATSWWRVDLSGPLEHGFGLGAQLIFGGFSSKEGLISYHVRPVKSTWHWSTHWKPCQCLNGLNAQTALHFANSQRSLIPIISLCFLVRL